MCVAVVKPGLEDSYSPLMAVTVGALLAVILLLAVAIFLMVRRRNKGCASPLAAKGALPGSDSSCGTAERSQGIDTALLVDTGYQEPYQALSYYSYSAIKPTGILLLNYLTRCTLIRHVKGQANSNDSCVTVILYVATERLNRL